MNDNFDLFFELQKLASTSDDVVVAIGEDGEVEFELSPELFGEILASGLV